MDMQKEPWDSSVEKAKGLKLSDFGTLEEVGVKAAPIRTAKNRKEAKEILKTISSQGLLTSSAGVAARLSSDTIGKIVSRDALNSSFDKLAHYHAAANLDKLFSNAIEPWKFELNPGKNNQGLKARRYLYAPLEYQGIIVPVKFTVKEYSDPALENKLYSIEAINVILGVKNKDAWYN
jgi:hypothetical protein